MGLLRGRHDCCALLCCLTLLCLGQLAPASDVATEVRIGRIDWKRLLVSGREPGQWLTGGRDYQQSYYSPLRSINTENIDRLGFAWQYDTRSTEGFEATPIVVDGVMFASGPRGAVYALDAGTGKERWVFTPAVDPDVMSKVCCGRVNRGVAVWEGSVYVGSLDGYLYALEAASGRIRWKVDTIADRTRGYSVTGAPLIAGRWVIIGNSGAEYDARGYVTAYELATGKQAWRFFTVPGDPRKGFEQSELAFAAQTWSPSTPWEAGLGGTVWDGMAYDPTLGLIYVGTGNGVPEPAAVRSPALGRNLFSCSILAIKAASGRLAWYYQTTPRDSWDYDADQKMILAELSLSNGVRKVLMQANKNGFFYVLDAASGALISATPYVNVTWATAVDTRTGEPLPTRQADYGLGPKIIFPSWWGGHNWQPMAYSPQTGFIYIPAMEAAVIFVATPGLFAYQRGGQNYMMNGVLPIQGPMGVDGPAGSGLPAIADLLAGQPDPRPRGALKAWDPIKHRVAWEIDTSGPWAGGPSALWNGGGVLATAGGLVFQGRATGELVVVDARNGREMKRVDVGTGMMAAPMTFSVNGEQLVAVMAGVGGSLGSLQPRGSAAYRFGNRGRIVAFRLGGDDVPHPPERVHGSDEFPRPAVPREGSASSLQRGASLFTRNCARCHTDDGEGSVPDLRRMEAQTHAQFSDILLKGARAARGMGNFSNVLSLEDVRDIHAFLVDLQWQAFENAHADPLRH